MVTIVGCKQIETAEGKVFTCIELQGDAKLVQSETTGKFYLSASKTRVTSSMPFEVCQMLLGQKLSGCVEKQSCEPYEYTNKETGEVLTLDYTYAYNPREKQQHQTQSMFTGFGQQTMMQQQSQSPFGEFGMIGVA